MAFRISFSVYVRKRVGAAGIKRRYRVGYISAVVFYSVPGRAGEYNPLLVRQLFGSYEKASRLLVAQVYHIIGTVGIYCPEVMV